MLARPRATLGCDVTFSVCVDVVLGVRVSEVEVNLSRMVGIGLGQSVAGRWGQRCSGISSDAEWRLLIANMVVYIIA